MKRSAYCLTNLMAAGFVLYSLLIVVACKAHKSPAVQDKVVATMTSFFTVSGHDTGSAEGIWIAEPDSVSNLIEKKYLSSYVAKPDEMQSNEMRARLKSLQVFFRIEGNSVTMLSIVNDSFGFSSGQFKKRLGVPASQKTYDTLMRGKQGSTTKAVVRLRKINGVDKLEYEENGLVMTAVRETRSAADLVTIYSQQVKAGTGLTQY